MCHSILLIKSSWCLYLIYFQNEYGVWEVFLPNNADGSSPIPHGSRVKVHFSCLVSYFWLKRLRASPNLIDVCFEFWPCTGENGYSIRDKGFNSCLDQVLSAGPRRDTIWWDLLWSSWRGLHIPYSVLINSEFFFFVSTLC